MNRGNLTIDEICEREGVVRSSAFKWLKDHASVAVMKKHNKSKKWTAEEKLKIIIETSAMNEDDLGVHLRRKGLHSHQLIEWREDILKGLAPISRKQQSPKDDRDGKIKELERELLRKDKALAEASALLILQKKIDLIWGSKDEDEK
jgi:transposase-like protein